MGHGLGWIADQLDDRDAAFAVSTLSLGEPSPTADLRPYIVEILDQETYPSCVAQALPQAIRIVQKRENPAKEPPLTSRFWTWYYARVQHGDEKNLSGTFIRLAVKAINKLGRVKEEDWPQVTNDAHLPKPTYATKPPPYLSMRAYDHRAVSYHRITEFGDARVAAVKASLSAGIPVVFGTQVGWSFTSDEGPTREIGPPIDEDWAGGHAMVLVAYDTAGAWLCNSWGQAWRAGGLAHILWEYIKWPQTLDLWSISL